MATVNSIKTAPKTLNESTLETNIVSEIASLFNSAFHFGLPFRLRYKFDISLINFKAFSKRKTKIYRLTPIEENKGGGWDSKISIPIGKNDYRAIFIQFKSGEHVEGNSIIGSEFNRSKKDPNPYVEFSFNDNKNNNQHFTLRKLVDDLVKKGITPKSVMYGFPRITSLSDFEKLQEDLILYTTFLTISEMDSEAKNASANLYDGKIHHFRTCYKDENKREISSVPFLLRENNEYESVLFEIIVVKLAYLRNLFPERVPIEIRNFYLFLQLAIYLKIDPSNLRDLNDYYYLNFIRFIDLKSYFKELVNFRDNNFKEVFRIVDFNSEVFAWRERLFSQIVNFFSSNQNKAINIQDEIPSRYTFTLQSYEPIEIDLGLEDSINLIVF